MLQYRVVLLLSFFLPSLVYSQSITITSPGSSTIVKEGDDFATDELGNPWDFLQEKDIGWEENFSGPSVGVPSGVWTAVNATPGGYVFPLFPGFARSLFSEGFSDDKNLPKLGINHRINASKYYYLSYRLNHSQRSTFAIYWDADDTRQEYWPDPQSPRCASADKFYNGPFSYAHTGFNTYSFDLRSINSLCEQKQGSWSGNPYVLRLDPSVGGGAGATTQIDWIRLVDPSSAPNHTINWSSSSVAGTIITIYYDNNASGYDGTPIARFTNGQNPGTYTFPTAILPPGDYYFYIESRDFSGNTLGSVRALSNYSPLLRITPKPAGYITAPSMTSGEEYSSSVLGNPWDMASSADIPNLDPSVWPDPFRQFSTPTFISGSSESTDGGSIFAAQANPPINGATESDAQIHLNVSKRFPIDTAKFRYLTYRINIDETNFPTMHDKIAYGWVMRPVWWNGNFTDDHHRPKAHIMYEGWHEYGTDLADPSIIEYGSPWSSYRSFDHFRIDPLETNVFTWFYLDYVKLYAENRASSGFYDITYSISDVGSGSVSASIYYDTNNSGYDGTLITTISGLSAGNYTYRWNTSSLPDQTSYYVYIVLSNGVSSTKFYSPVHVKTGAYVAPILLKPEFDFDGDGKSDQIVYRAPAGGGKPITKTTGKGKRRKTQVIGYTPYPAATYFINRSGEGFQQVNWGDNRHIPIYADVDGDGASDRGLLIQAGSTLHWYFIRSGNGATLHRTWGLPGDKIVIGDYNGNGSDEVAVYRNGAWYIVDENGNGISRNWGVPGTDIPVPADYDGDGKTDLAIFRKTDGNWWIQKSSDGQTITAQWGLEGDIPLAGDFSSDGRADLVVFRPSSGTWYVKNLQDDSVITQAWGLPSDMPFVNHDVNGDGVNDFVVYRQSNGTWYYNLRNGQTTSRQFGMAGDLPPIKVSR